METFQPGQCVQWTTGARGRTTTKYGIVYKLVPANTIAAPVEEFPLNECSRATLVQPQSRNVDAYLIIGHKLTRDGRAKLYFPNPKYLRRAN